jgi:integrase
VLPESAGGAYEPLSRALTLEQVPLLLAELEPARAATCAYVVALAADWCAVERAERGDLGGLDACNLLCLVRGTKNAKRWADVPIVPPFQELAEVARAWLAEHGAFPAWGNSVRDLAAACKRAGLPRVTIRDLRRTHGQILASRGVAPHLIGGMLRHSDSRMAETTYGQRTRADVGRQVARVTRAG